LSLEAEIRFKIGGMVIALISMDQGNFSIDGSYRRFLTDETPQVRLRAVCGEVGDFHGWQEVFETGGVWQLYQSADQWGVRLHSPVLGDGPYQVAIFEEDFLSGEIITDTSKFAQGYYPFPLRYPLAEVLMINLLGRGRGVLVHACAIKDGERGLLFAGTSGAGKSTTARIWEKVKGATLLSDDRVILRKRDGKFWIYGTPWHGDARAVSPEVVPLTDIYILEHAEENRVEPVKPLQATSQLFVRSFPPFWDKEGVDYSLGFLAELSQTVPCQTLGFVPDATMVDFIRCLGSG
jgi:hypothetical protein